MAQSIVIFGASGDLTSRKLIPALYSLFRKDRLPGQTRIVGVSRSPFEHAQWRADLRATTAKFSAQLFEEDTWDAFSENIYYQPGDIKESADFDKLRAFLDDIEQGQANGRLY